MYRQAKLVTSAEDLQHKIWLSLPLNVRFAGMMRRLIVADWETWRVFNAVAHAGMILKGTRNMPPVPGWGDPVEYVANTLDRQGRPAFDESPAKFDRLVSTLYSKKYGADFGSKVWKTVLKTLKGRQDVAEDIFQEHAGEFRTRVLPRLDEGRTYSQVSSYIADPLIKAAISYWRDTKRKRKLIPGVNTETEFSGPEGDQVRQEYRTVPDVETFADKMEQDHTAGEINRILKDPDVVRRLRAIHKQAPDYLLMQVGLGPYKHIHCDDKGGAFRRQMCDTEFLAAAKVEHKGKPLYPTSDDPAERKRQTINGASTWNYMKNKILAVMLDEVDKQPEVFARD